MALQVGEMRQHLDVFMKRHGFRRLRKGVFEIETVDGVRLILEESFTANGGDVNFVTIAYLDFISTKPLLEEIYGKKWIWPGLAQFHLTTIFARELKEFDRYYSSLDVDSIDKLLSKYIELARRIKAENHSLIRYVTANSESLDKPYKFAQPNAVTIIALLTCELELARYERVERALHWIRSDNGGVPLSEQGIAQLDRVQKVLEERRSRTSLS